MSRLEVEFLDKVMKNPIVVASGTYGFGTEYSNYYSPSILGGICSKGITLNKKIGNDGIRIWESSCGLINSIGLENPGIEDFIINHMEEINNINTMKIVNLGGNTLDDYITAIEILNKHEIDLIELNISCPNVKEGGMAFGLNAKSAGEITAKVKKKSRHNIMVKLSPNAENIVEVAKACENSGADAFSLVNTFQAMAIDINERKPVFENIYAGLSGPAIKPIALRMVHQVSKNVHVPVMGIGGIMNWKDALEFIMAGATCVQMGTANFVDPYAPVKTIDDLEGYCIENKIENIMELIGII
ncbi:MAG: dihydroorotate dehydrogenase [Eubacteriaceae bacterium]